ncbi:hypothetical protein [Clostridium celatum]|uniref:hypothetical protein n=1 Tax=Clostridium celatum TaxID=36834 RepID=UPI00319DA25C
MKTYLKEVVDMHQLALSLTYTEATILYDVLFEFTDMFHSIDETTNDIYIPEEKFIEIYSSIMFRFMTILINLK